MIKSFFSIHVLTWLCLFFFAETTGLRAADEWQVPEASIRYKLEVYLKPTHPSAGYFLHLPDGGILGGGSFKTVVMAEGGKIVPSYLFWQNPESGFSVVFADPGKKVKFLYLYVVPGGAPQFWSPLSNLTPSALLCSLPGRASIPAALELAKLGRVESSVHVENHAGLPRRAPFSIGGDLAGHPRPGSFYLLSYVDAPELGSYWIAPFNLEGETQVFIDGNRLYPKERSKNWGGIGAAVDLIKGLHRVEVYQTADGTGPYVSDKKEGGLMYLTWKLPSEAADQLKGAKSRKGAESRVLNQSEIVHSGSCWIKAVEARNGAPAAAAKVVPGLCYWFENEDPLIIYELHAMTEGQPAGATYTWTFSKGCEIQGADVQWIFPGFRDSNVKLTVKSGQAVSSCTVPLFGFSTQPTSLENSNHRKAFRTVLGTMLKSFAQSSPDPVAAWGDAWWNNLLRTVEGGNEAAFLAPLFTDHLDLVRKKLSPPQLFVLQDLLLDWMQRQNPGEALQWLQKFQPDAATVASRKSELRLREGELQMFYLNDPKSAEKIFTEMTGLPVEFAERAKVRLGDLALIKGDLNKATTFYAEVQKSARTRRNSAPALPSGPGANPPAGIAASPAQGGKTAPGVELKLGALQEVSLSENVRSLTAGNFLIEARQSLLTWEIEFPLSKISGDYILRESAFLIKMGEWKRARIMLEAYCREIDASAFLPDAASMLIACVKGSNEPPSKSMIEIIEKVKGRLQFHPVAAELEQFLSSVGKTSPTKP